MSHGLHQTWWQRRDPRVVAALLLILAVASALRFVGLGVPPLIGDESYYWLWSRHPAWAYYDHPAGVSLLIRASTALIGSSPFGIRWLNAMAGVACVLLTWLVGARLLSRRAGLYAAAAVAVGAPFLITARFVYTNALFLCLMLVNVLAFWQVVRESARQADGFVFGLTLALLFNTKYNAYVYAVALAVVLLLDHRHLLRASRLWIGVAIGMLGLIPVAAWNAAHDWMSFRWQLSHLTHPAVHDPSLLGSAHHAWVYLTGPLVVLAAGGLGRLHNAAERLLTVIALFLLVPVALSPINSPRNLSSGLVPLLLLAGARLPHGLTSGLQRAVAGVCISLLLGVTIFGLGTVANLAGPSPLPQSSIVPAIRRDAAGWPALGAFLEQAPGPIFAVDYSLAAQIAYYAERPAFTAWGQYLLWGIPPLKNATVVALDYLDPEVLTDRLQEAYEHVEGPEQLAFAEPGNRKTVHVWRAEGLTWDREVFLQRFDFLTLLAEID